MIEGLDHLLAGNHQPGLAELRQVLHELLDKDTRHGRVLEVCPLHPRKRQVFSISFGLPGRSRTVVIKRLKPVDAYRNQLVLRRWLPAVGMGDCAAALLGVAAERNGEWVWHVYEYLGEHTLDSCKTDQPCVQAVASLIARLHTGFAEHPLLAECRQSPGNLGISFYAANVRDAIHCLEKLHAPEVKLTKEQAVLRDRLLARMFTLLDEETGRAQALAELGGPDTLLHGDLWTNNAIVLRTRLGLQARLIDWDHAGVGSFSYDLSTFLLRFPAGQRPGILNLYRDAIAPAGWELPQADELNLLFETAEFARFANRIIWPALALAQEQAAWGFEALAEVEQWFSDWSPVLPREITTRLLQLVEQ